MTQMILAEEGGKAMALVGALLDNPELNVEVVTDGRSLLDRLNEAPNYFHAVVMAYDLPEISGSECLTFIKRFHNRLLVLVLSDSVGTDRMTELANLGVRTKHVLDRSSAREAFANWVQFSLDEAGVDGGG